MERKWSYEREEGDEMNNFFPWSIVILFSLASTICAVEGEWGKASFYLLSALINLNVIFLK